ncbi:hypothetical protein [Edaphovirga cremea]|uniref:phage tail fiber protein n=1 Tax=Edaphovirga cremea TaxID=2267246 RepID=UPI003988C315
MWYRTGTITATKSSKVVTGTGTKWADAKQGVGPGQMLLLPAAGTVVMYEIASVQSNTQLTLVDAFTGTTVTAQAYAIVTTYIDSVPDFARRLASQLSDYQSQLDGWQSILTGTGDVTLTAPNGTSVTVASMSKMQGDYVSRTLGGIQNIEGGIKVSGEIQATAPNTYRLVQGGYGSFWRQDTNNLYLMLTNNKDEYGSYNSLRPFRVALDTGNVVIESKLTANTFVDNATNIGKTSTGGKTFTAIEDWSKPVGYSSLLNAVSTNKPPALANTYTYWNVLGKRDTEGGYGGILLNYGTGDAYIGVSINEITAPTWNRLYSEKNKPTAADVGALAVGAGGWLGTTSPAISDIEAVSANQLWRASTNATGGPDATAPWAGFQFGFDGASRWTMCARQGVNTIDLRTRVRAPSGWGSWVAMWHTGNTSVDANGFIKKASPIARLTNHPDKMQSDFLDGFTLSGLVAVNPEATGVTAVKVATGVYEVTGSLGFSLEGWTVEIPQDVNGNRLCFVATEVDHDGKITVSVSKRRFDIDTAAIVAGDPMDIPDGRWIDLRINMPASDIEDMTEVDELIAQPEECVEATAD